MGMFHIVGVTPEARTLKDAFGDRTPTHKMTIAKADVDAVYASYSGKGDPLNLVVFSAPQLSIYEMKLLSELFARKRVDPRSQVIITTSNGVISHCRQLGYLQALEQAGVVVLEGVCFYILQNLPQMRIENKWRNIVTNSAKLANIIGAHKFNAILRTTQQCVDIAVDGEE
jgi:predicted aconitase